MIYNPFNRLLRQEADGSDPNTDIQGLSSRMEDFLNANPDVPDPIVAAPESSGAGNVPPENKPEDKPDEEPELPRIGKTAPVVEKGFDEAAFDAETEGEVKGMAPDQANRWKILKGKVKEAKKEAEEAKAKATTPTIPKEVEAEITTLKAKAAEADALRQRNEELLRANDQVAARETPEFIAAVTKPIDEMTQIIKAIAESNSIDPRLLAAVIEEEDIGKQDQMLDDLQGKLGARLTGRMERLADDYKIIRAKENAILSEASKNVELSRLNRHQEEARQKEQNREFFRTATTEAFTTHASRIPGFVDSSGQLTDLAKAVMNETSAIDPSTLAPSDLAYMAFAANSLPEARKAILELQKENAILRAGKGAAAPLAGSSSPPPANEEDANMTLAEKMRGKQFTFSGA